MNTPLLRIALVLCIASCAFAGRQCGGNCNGHGQCKAFQSNECDMRCKCSDDFCGNDCSIDWLEDGVGDPASECCPKQCSSHGSCAVHEAKFMCICHQGWSGVSCEAPSGEPECSTPPGTMKEEPDAEVNKEVTAMMAKAFPGMPMTVGTTVQIPDMSGQGAQSGGQSQGATPPPPPPQRGGSVGGRGGAGSH
eukprot:GFYU01007001.1.p2 GENE.GFYU01007001.1~~GFYU01007001.1.p2  ORF type:complete len:193 (-),score=53.96 GFYU01007001.1:720-1298(-)